MNVHHNPNTVHRGMYMNSTVPMTPGGSIVKVAMVDRRHQRCNHPTPLMTPVTNTHTPAQTALGIAHCTIFYARLLATLSTISNTNSDDVHHCQEQI